MSNNGKDQRLEYLRVFSCFMVILGHIANWYMREYPNLPIDSYVCALAFNGICRVSVPIFFMISGALLLEKPINLKKSINRTSNMLLKTVIWTLIYIVWGFLYLNEKYNFQEMFATPVRVHFWFMFVMVGIYATVPFWQKLVSDAPKELLQYFSILFIAISVIDFILKSNNMGVAYEIPLVGNCCYVCYFIMGYVIRHYIDEIKIKKWISLLIIIGCVIVTDSFTFLYTKKLGVHFEAFSGFQSVFIGLSAMSVFYLVLKMNNLKQCTFITIISKHSFSIYMTHVFFLDILQENLDVSKISAWIGFPLFFIILLATSFGFSWILDKAKAGHPAL